MKWFITRVFVQIFLKTIEYPFNYFTAIFWCGFRIIFYIIKCEEAKYKGNLHFSWFFLCVCSFTNYAIAFSRELVRPIKGYQILSTARSRVENELWRERLSATTTRMHSLFFIYERGVKTVILVYCNYKNLTQDWHTSFC